MKRTEINKLRGKQLDELEKELKKLREDIQKTILSTDEQKDTNNLVKKRKVIATIKTIIREINIQKSIKKLPEKKHGKNT